MDSTDATEVGPRVEALRKAKGLSRERLAQVAEVSPSLIKSVETGRRALTLRTAQRLAPILGVTDLSQLYGPTVQLPLGERASHPAAPEVRIALTTWPIRPTGHAESADYLRGALDHAWQTWHSSPRQRTEAGAVLPGLLTAGQRAARIHEGAERRRAAAMFAEICHLAQAYLAWHGDRESCWLAVDRGMMAALDSDDPLAIASSTWYAVHLLRAVGRSEEALDHLRDARALIQEQAPIAAAIEAHDPHSEGLGGAAESSDRWAAMLADLWLCSAITKARVGDQSAWADWAEAKSVVGRMLPADYVHPWTRVGPVLVEASSVMIAVDLGDTDDARRRAQNLDPATIPSVERRARHLIELARAVNMQGSREAALHLLTQAASVSVETVQFSPAAREMVVKLLREVPAASRAEAEALASRISLEL